MIKTRLAALTLIFFMYLPSIAQVSMDQSQPKALYENGMFLMNKKNYGGARSFFEQYRDTEDKRYEVEADYYIAICALKLYHLDGEKLIQDFIAQYPNSPQSAFAYVEMGEYFFQDRNYKQAVVYLSKVDQRSISSQKRSDVQYKLGYSYFATKNFDKALVEFNKVKKSRSQFKPASHYYAGFVEYDQEDYKAALQDYLAIENEKAFAASVPYMITSIHYKSGDYNAVIDYTKPIIDSKRGVQQRGQMAILLAEAYYANKKYGDASFYFDLAKKSEKFTAQSVYHYGLSSARSGNEEKAISLLKSIAGQGNIVGAMASFDLARIYLEQGNDEFAFTAFKSVIDNKSGGEYIVEASFSAGVLAYKLGRYSECISILTTHLENYPGSQYVSQINDILAPAFLNTRNYKPALDYIEGLEQRSNTVLRAYQQATYHYGVEYYNDRKFTDAIGYFKKSLENKIMDSYTQKANLWIGEAYSIGRRYEEALPYYNAAVNLGSLGDGDDYLRASYGRGYAFYNTAAYAKALQDFKRFVDNGDKESNQYGDALVRLADCYYVKKDYNTALGYFAQAIQSKVNEKDYAYYQAGVIYGIQGDVDRAISYLNRVINVYTRSAFYDDALFERGLIELKDEKYQAALESFNKLATEKSRSPYAAFALERSAVANFNLGRYDKTVSLYQEFINKYPNNPNIGDALIGLQESMRLTGQEAQFETILADFRLKNPDISGLEKVEFESLKGQYNNQEYEKAARGLSGFITAYPNDFNLNEARYLLAESLYRLDRTDSALSVYKRLYTDGAESRIHRITERIADIEFNKGNWAEANRYYKALADLAVSNNQKLRAWKGLMNAYFILGNYDSTLVYVDYLLENGGQRNDFIVEANLKKGLTYLNLGQFENALLSLEQTTELSKDRNGAEAQYYIGLILHQQEDYINSNEALYAIPEQYGMYAEWLDKGFLLVAENFIAQKEYFQAKATLQSIIDNSGDPNTVREATERLAWVDTEETKEVNLVPDSLNTVEIDTSSNNEGY